MQAAHQHMTLTFLGTGPAIAIPRKGCGCRTCRRGGKSRRTRSSALARHGNKNILIDAGPDIIEQLRREKVKRIDRVLITHAHSDAAGGIKNLDRWLSKNQKTLPVTVFAEKHTIQKIRNRWKKLSALAFVAVRPLVKMKIAELTVTPFRVSHSMTPGFPTLGFKIGKRLAYASDVSGMPKSSKKLIRGIRTLVLDGAMYLKRHIKSHLSADESVRMAGDLRAENLILTQIGHSYPPHEQAEKELRQYLRSRHTRRPKTLRIAFDGMKIAMG
jgi:phosphoribosyl 1,2-cyclic phosphate phosphodiesterase